jgi:hypothetical protein
MICQWFDLKINGTIFSGLGSKPITTVFSDLVLKSVAMVSPDLTLKSRLGFPVLGLKASSSGLVI